MRYDTIIYVNDSIIVCVFISFSTNGLGIKSILIVGCLPRFHPEIARNSPKVLLLRVDPKG
jgi:hypothetical protein